MPHSPTPQRRRRLHLPRRAKYPIWSVKTITAYALVLILLTATCVFLLGKRSIFRDTELTLAIVSAALFVFLAVGLYHGVRVRRKDLPAAQMPDMPTPDFEAPDLSGFDVGLDGDEGCLAVVAGFLLAVLAAIVLVVVLYFLIYLGVVLWVFLLVALGWVFYLALRQVFAKSRVCRGKLGKSLGYALVYTALYTGWLFALVLIADAVFGPRLRQG